MIAAIPTSAGLGDPPKSFTTNNNESLNNVLKQKVDYKRNEWTSFNKLLRSLCEQQRECAKSVFGEGTSLKMDWIVSRAMEAARWKGV